ncbi:MAG: cellulase family glycosylhydrolase, partial [Lachnospiraceae bacterium]|nr:cellulase family glycosylhydrolase [Lachnospiraceae bacterium]
MGNNLRRVITYLVCFSLVVASIGVFGVTESSKKAEAATSFTDLNQEAIVEAMGAGWNLGNQFEATDGSGNPSETAWGNPVVTENLIKLVKNAGFKTIRIPVSYLNKISYDSSSDTYVIDSGWLNRIQEVVDLCVKNDLYAIINMHGDGYTTVTGSWLLCNSSDQTTIKKKYADCWEQIANKFADYDEHLIFESMNEEFDGNYGWPNSTYYSNINAYNQIFVDTVRNTGSNNAKRWLLIPGWNTNIEYTTGSYGFELPTDNYLDSSISGNRIMISVHYYDPWDFAGEGSVTQWGKNATGTVSSWGQEDWMSSQFDLLYNKFVSNGYPVVIGEYGATNASTFDSENLSCRKYYYKYLCQQAYVKGCVPVAWDNNGHSTQYRADQFGLFDRWTLAVTSNGQEIIDSIMAVYNAADNCTSTGLSLNKTSLTVKIGETETLVASLTPSTSTDTITWVSSDPTVATVIDGLVTPVKAGTCTVTAKTANGNTATCSVTIEEADIVKLQLFLMNSASWTTVSSETVEVPSTGGTYTLSVTDTQADLQKIASFYMHDINADLSDTSEDKSSACDYLSFKITSFTVNGTECPIISGYDTFTYDTSLTSEDAHNKKSIDFDFINGWNEERQSILENVYEAGQYAYTFNNISLNSDSNEIAITFEITGAESSEEDTTDQDAAEAVEALINEIGTVEYTDECLALIEAAEDGYDALTDTQKALVTNYETLTTARSEYDELKAAAEAAAAKAAADQAAAEAVEGLIDAIGTVEYTDECL